MGFGKWVGVRANQTTTKHYRTNLSIKIRCMDTGQNMWGLHISLHNLNAAKGIHKHRCWKLGMKNTETFWIFCRGHTLTSGRKTPPLRNNSWGVFDQTHKNSDWCEQKHNKYVNANSRFVIANLKFSREQPCMRYEKYPNKETTHKQNIWVSVLTLQLK